MQPSVHWLFKLLTVTEQRGLEVQVDPALHDNVSPHLCSVCASSVDLWHEIVSISDLFAVSCKK